MSAIEFNHVSKSYQLGVSRTSFRETLSSMGRKLTGRKSENSERAILWALDDVDFQVQPGEVLGIIGPNGAGKSTALKLLSKVTFPSSGLIKTNGRMAALIELGAGFHPDLTGRENIFLNGVVLGLTRQEITNSLESIISFANLEKFIDTPVKRYSSGMYVRLAFSVAIHVKADILLVDEVLSVGDMNFQQKSMAKMNEMRDNGTTIVFVSHYLNAVQSFCKRVIFLMKGKIQADGDPETVIESYKRKTQEATREELRRNENQVIEDQDKETEVLDEFIRAELTDCDGQPRKEFNSTDRMRVKVKFSIPKRIQRPVFHILVKRRRDDFICFSRYHISDVTDADVQGNGEFEGEISKLLLVAGEYNLIASIFSFDYNNEKIDSLPASFSISGRIRSDQAGVFEPEVNWVSIPNR